jgi:hypothetical protein
MSHTTYSLPGYEDIPKSRECIVFYLLYGKQLEGFGDAFDQYVASCLWGMHAFEQVGYEPERMDMERWIHYIRAYQKDVILQNKSMNVKIFDKDTYVHFHKEAKASDTFEQLTERYGTAAKVWVGMEHMDFNRTLTKIRQVDEDMTPRVNFNGILSRMAAYVFYADVYAAVTDGILKTKKPGYRNWLFTR